MALEKSAVLTQYILKSPPLKPYKPTDTDRDETTIWKNICQIPPGIRNL